MGYNVREGLVEKNQDILEVIAQVDKTGQAVSLQYAPGDLSKEAYHIRRVLKATELLREECGGKFVDLGLRISLRMDYKRSAITVTPKDAQPERPQPKIIRETETEALQKLLEYKGSLQILEFYPSEEYSEEAFSERLEAVGWSLIPNTQAVSEDGRLKVTVERSTEEGDLRDIL